MLFKRTNESILKLSTVDALEVIKTKMAAATYSGLPTVDITLIYDPKLKLYQFLDEQFYIEDPEDLITHIPTEYGEAHLRELMAKNALLLTIQIL